jgi:hypothetical protein
MKYPAALLIIAAGLASLSAQVPIGLPVILTGSVAPATLANLSCRTYVGPNSPSAIIGFVVTGQAGSSVDVLLRAVGPTLAQFGVSGVLSQPVLTLFDSTGTLMATNTGWSANPWAYQISNAATLAGAFALPQRSSDSAILATLSPGSYTAVVSGLNGTAGNVLIEAYSVPPQTPPPPVSPPFEPTPGAGGG